MYTPISESLARTRPPLDTTMNFHLQNSDHWLCDNTKEFAFVQYIKLYSTCWMNSTCMYMYMHVRGTKVCIKQNREMVDRWLALISSVCMYLASAGNDTFCIQRCKFISWFLSYANSRRRMRRTRRGRRRRKTWQKCESLFQTIMYILHHKTTKFCIP